MADISDHLADEAVTIWLDLRDPDRDDLTVLSSEFGLHPLAIEDAVHEHQRPKLDRYRSHLFLSAYEARLDTVSGELATSELAAFVTARALITVRKDDGLDIGALWSRFAIAGHPGLRLRPFMEGALRRAGGNQRAPDLPVWSGGAAGT